MRRNGRRGNSAIEFAVSFSLLFSVFTGTFQFGYTFFLYNRLESAVRDGARYASMRAYDSSTSNPSAAFQAAVKNTVVYGNSAGGGQPVVPGLATGHVKLDVTMVNGVPDQVAVSLNGYRLDALFTAFNLSGRPAAAFPYLGRYAGGV